MKIKKVYLTNYRNFLEEDFSFHPNLNIIYGENAQGKSNLLEAIYYLSFLSSFRTSNDKNLINFKNDFFKIECLLERDSKLVNLEILYHQGKKRIKRDGLLIKRILDYIGTVFTVLFTPDDIFIIKGGPQYRRKFLDRTIWQVFPRYYTMYSDFKKILYQRNMLLKQIRAGKAGIGQLEIWNPQYANICSQILKRRVEVLLKIKELASKYHSNFTNQKEKLSLEYKMNGVQNEVSTFFNADNFLKLLNNSKSKEIERGVSLIGPHRDDIFISSNFYSLKDYGSQGQQRTAVLSLKMSELEFIYKETGKFPILLLDDVMSELDLERQNLLTSNLTSGVQTFITTTDFNLGKRLGIEHLGIEIRDGNLVSKN